MAAFGKERGYTDSGPSPPPRCVDALLFHVGERRSAAGYSCSTSGRTNVLIQQHPQGAFFQHGCFQIRRRCSWWCRHQVALKVFPLHAPTYIPNNDVIFFIPLYHMAQTGSLLLSMWIYSVFANTTVALLDVCRFLFWFVISLHKRTTWLQKGMSQCNLIWLQAMQFAYFWKLLLCNAAVIIKNLKIIIIKGWYTRYVNETIWYI